LEGLTLNASGPSNPFQDCTGQDLGFYADVTLSNNLIVSNSIILVTLERVASSAGNQVLVASVFNKEPGSATIRIVALGGPSCNLAAATILIHYQIINPAP